MIIPLFLPIVIWGAALGITALLGLGGYALFSEGDPEKNKLGVLGMLGAGKTRFLSHLRQIPFDEKQTSKEEYQPFTYRNGEKVIPIDAGVDIGGGNMYRGEYNRIINKSDVIFYFFDISKYLNDNILIEGVSYRRACNSRIEHIHSAIRGTKTSVIFVGTHIDSCVKGEAKVKSEFLKLIDDKSYYSALKNTEFIDLTNANQLSNFINKVFK